uniref:Uncharacterized protein n=1 Tax=Arundo donax TaxID=35708 RepID=A0A0A9D309_ARUDO
MISSHLESIAPSPQTRLRLPFSDTSRGRGAGGACPASSWDL